MPLAVADQEQSPFLTLMEGKAFRGTPSSSALIFLVFSFYMLSPDNVIYLRDLATGIEPYPVMLAWLGQHWQDCPTINTL